MMPRAALTDLTINFVHVSSVVKMQHNVELLPLIQAE